MGGGGSSLGLGCYTPRPMRRLVDIISLYKHCGPVGKLSGGLCINSLVAGILLLPFLITF